MSTLHVIGGGLAGLSAAVEASGAMQVRLYESAKVCGGRARSFYDKALDRHIDNGNHLILSANRATLRYLGLIGAWRELTGPNAPIFPWYDVTQSKSWVVHLNRGRLPLWALAASRRPPGMRLRDFKAVVRLLLCAEDASVTACLGEDALSRSLLAPFAVAALNTQCTEGSAKLLRNVMRESLLKGGHACIPLYSKQGLSEAFVAPAEAHLTRMQAIIRTNCRVTGLQVTDARVRALEIGQEIVPLSELDRVVFAAPASVARALLAPHWPDFESPDAFESIINVHFALDGPVSFTGAGGRAGFIGVNGGMTEWIYLKPDLLSVTISAANRYLSCPQEELVRRVWGEVKQVVQPFAHATLPLSPPPVRVIVEKRATFAATPEQDRKRPSASTPFHNLALAGDWTQTGLPSTLEGAIRSGVNAYQLLRETGKG